MQYNITKIPQNTDEMNMLDTLASMRNQYCSHTGHCFMSAGENCSAILQEYGLLPDDEDGRDPTVGMCEARYPDEVFTKYVDPRIAIHPSIVATIKYHIK